MNEPLLGMNENESLTQGEHGMEMLNLNIRTLTGQVYALKFECNRAVTPVLRVKQELESVQGWNLTQNQY